MRNVVCVGLLLTFAAPRHVHGALARLDPALRGSTRLPPDRFARTERTQSWDVASTSLLRNNETAVAAYSYRQPRMIEWNRYGELSREQIAAWKLKDKPIPLPSLNYSNESSQIFVASKAFQGPARYVGCQAIQACTVSTQRVAAELSGQIVLLLGCSLDIYALDNFCKSANAVVVGFTRKPGHEEWGVDNFAYCNIGGVVLAYSFHPGSSGPPYFKECDTVLHGRCSTVTSKQLAQESVARVEQIFGKPPSAIVVDSSLWDAANWWAQAGKPPEPYLVDSARVDQWCTKELPDLINSVQVISPSSKVAYRTAPRVEPAFGYGHSMHNIDMMNTCLRSATFSHKYHLIDYNFIVDWLLISQGIPGYPKPFYEDPFHPGMVPSVLYIDAVLQWVKATKH